MRDVHTAAQLPQPRAVTYTARISARVRAPHITPTRTHAHTHARLALRQPREGCGNTNSCLQYAFLVASGDMDKREQKQKYAHATPPNLSLRTTHPANHTCCVPVRRESKTRVAELRKQVHHELLKKLREDEPENENRVDSWRYGMSVERVRCIAHSTLAPHIACAPLLTLPQS